MKKKEPTFIKQTLKSQLNISAVYTIHYFKYGKNFRFKEESHNFFELVYLDSGHAIALSNGKKIDLEQGQAIIHKPNEKHTIYTNDKFANSAIISFECKDKVMYELCGKILNFDNEQKSLLNKVINEAKLSYTDPLNELNLTKMNKRAVAPFGGDQIIKNCTELLFISLLRNLYSADNQFSPSVGGLHSPLVQDIMNMLNDRINSCEPVSLEEISFGAGYSKSYIKTKFKQETGKSILQFFIEMKIERAKMLLSHGDKTVNEVSDSLGFNSVQYFCRQFKLHTDMTPTTYANSIKTDHLL